MSIEIYVIIFSTIALMISSLGTINYAIHNKKALRQREKFKKLDNILIGTTGSIECEKLLDELDMKHKKKKLIVSYYYYDSFNEYKKIGERAIIKFDRHNLVSDIERMPLNKYSENLDILIDGSSKEISKHLKQKRKEAKKNKKKLKRDKKRAKREKKKLEPKDKREPKSSKKNKSKKTK